MRKKEVFGRADYRCPAGAGAAAGGGVSQACNQQGDVL